MANPRQFLIVTKVVANGRKILFGGRIRRQRPGGEQVMQCTVYIRLPPCAVREQPKMLLEQSVQSARHRERLFRADKSLFERRAAQVSIAVGSSDQGRSM